MTVRRLLLTSAAMAAVAAALRALAGPWRSALATLASAPAVSATSGPEDVVLAAAGVLAWAVWAWGALGLLLTAASAAASASSNCAVRSANNRCHRTPPPPRISVDGDLHLRLVTFACFSLPPSTKEAR